MSKTPVDQATLKQLVVLQCWERDQLTHPFCQIFFDTTDGVAWSLDYDYEENVWEWEEIDDVPRPGQRDKVAHLTYRAMDLGKELKLKEFTISKAEMSQSNDVAEALFISSDDAELRFQMWPDESRYEYSYDE